MAVRHSASMSEFPACSSLSSRVVPFSAVSFRASIHLRPRPFREFAPFSRFHRSRADFNTAGGVTVVADSTWAAMQGRRALVLKWDKGQGGNESTETLRNLIFKRAAAPPTFVAVGRGDALDVLAGSAKTLEASYESPFQAHATMEPMNTTVHVRDHEIEVWSPTQFADEVQKEIAKLSGLPLNKVIVHMTLSGGSFGRRYQWDYAAEAWQVAKEMKKPVQLLWTREDDMQHDFYRPYNYQRLSGAFDDSGQACRVVYPACYHTYCGVQSLHGVYGVSGNVERPRHHCRAGMVRRRRCALLDTELSTGICSRRFGRAALLVAVRGIVLYAVCEGMLCR